jgi:hypothetical protein
VDVGAVEHHVEGRSERAVSVADQEPDLFATLAELPQEDAGLLGHSGAGEMGGDPGEVHAATACSIMTRM